MILQSVVKPTLRNFLPVFLCLFFGVPQAFAKAPSVERFALIIGANDGGKERVKLLYAGKDAKSFSHVLEQLGGLSSNNRFLLLDPNRGTLEAKFRQIAKQISASTNKDTRIEFLLYYSGHSDEQGILLAEEHFTYAELRKQIDAIPADVRIAVFDSCSSGAFTRSKGGIRKPPFLSDESTKVKGHAFLTSSSADETAQEADSIASSFFTHFLISGLRGAADSNQDSKVTLHEVYQFAFQETLSRTEKTIGGPQHPAYDIQLVGSGDLVLTDLRGTSAGLVLEPSLEGRIAVRDQNGQLIVELAKTSGQEVELGLEPGSYRIILDTQNQTQQALVDIPENERKTLLGNAFASVPIEIAMARGTNQDMPKESTELVITPPLVKAPTEKTATPVSIDSQYKVIPVNLSLAPKVSLNQLSSKKPVNYFSLGLPVSHTARLHGVAFSAGVSVVDEELIGMQTSLGGNFAQGNMKGWQLSLGFNSVFGRANGLQTTLGVNTVQENANAMQIALGANFVQKNFTGLQLSLGTNWVSGETQGAQFSLVSNLSLEDAKALQATLGINVVNGEFLGAQASLVANIAAEDAKGLQMSTGLNLVRGKLYGAQLSSGVNLVREIEGLQVGLINIGGQVDGAQLGLVNVAKQVKGTQIGLVNISDNIEGLPVGLINYPRRGRFAFELFTSDVNDLNVAAKIGSKKFHSIVTAGIDGDNQKARYSFGLGLGTHFEWKSLFADIDLIASGFGVLSNPARELPALLGNARLIVGAKLLSRISVFGGPTLNTLFSFEGQNFDFGGIGFGEEEDLIVIKEGQTSLRISPGLVLGIGF